jgi:hypothetical protein
MLETMPFTKNYKIIEFRVWFACLEMEIFQGRIWWWFRKYRSSINSITLFAPTIKHIAAVLLGSFSPMQSTGNRFKTSSIAIMSQSLFIFSKMCKTSSITLSLNNVCRIRLIKTFHFSPKLSILMHIPMIMHVFWSMVQIYNFFNHLKIINCGLFLKNNKRI